MKDVDFVLHTGLQCTLYSRSTSTRPRTETPDRRNLWQLILNVGLYISCPKYVGVKKVSCK